MGKKRMAFKPAKPQPESGEENKEESSDESLRATPPPSPLRASESDEPKRTNEVHHSSHGGRKTRLTSGKRPSEDTDGNGVKKMKIGMEEGHHSSNGGRKTRLTSGKRPSEDTDVKKVTTDKKSNNSQRVWSEEDEIVLLNGILDYSKEMGTNPNEDWNAFSEFMRGKVHLDFTKVQLQDKIRWLKKKFTDNKGKKGKDKKNKERVFSTPHEQSLYDLSTQIWGDATSKPDGNASEFEEINDGGNAVVEKPNGKVNVSVVEENKDGGNAAVEKPNRKANASVVEEIKDGGNAIVKKPKRKANASVVEEIKDGPNAVGKKPNKKVTASEVGEVDGGDGGKWKELNPSAGIEETMLRYGKEIYESVHGNEEKTEWNKLRVEEMELYLKQLEVRVMQTKLVLSVLKREDHRGEDKHA